VPHLIAILEDDPRRGAEMRRCIESLGGWAECAFRASAPEMIALLEERASETALVSLDHDLGPNREIGDEVVDPGTGRDVADWLARNGPVRPVIVHSSNGFAARDMLRRLEGGGRGVERVMPHSGLGWVEASWLSTVIEMLPAGDE